MKKSLPPLSPKRRINTYKKGARTQRKAKKYYESEGYEVEVVRYSKWMLNKDFFGLWDLICVGAHDIRFVQVKTNNKPSREWEEKAIKWGPKIRNSTILKEYVVYKDYQKGIVPSARVTLGPSY